jgi:3D (Asp-Asp-Asp) domain-containing protein
VEKVFKNKIVFYSIAFVYSIILCVASFGCNIKADNNSVSTLHSTTNTESIQETTKLDFDSLEATSMNITTETTSAAHTKITTIKETSTPVVTIPVRTSLGYFKITVYCPSSDSGRWEYYTSTGVRSTHLKTCAVDPNVIPLHSTIMVNGLVLNAVDTGSKVKGNVIDIFYDGTEKEAVAWAYDFGTRHEVFFIE